MTQLSSAVEEKENWVRWMHWMSGFVKGIFKRD